VQVLGVHQLTYTSPSGKPSTENVVVMENLFHNAKITRIFDLKGKVRIFCVGFSSMRPLSSASLTNCPCCEPFVLFCVVAYAGARLA
jgi:hypothetical protein